MSVKQDVPQEQNVDLSALSLGIDDTQEVKQLDGLKSLILAVLPGADNMAPEFLDEMAGELLNSGVAGAIADEVKKLSTGQSSEASVQKRIKDMILFHQNRLLQENQQLDEGIETVVEMSAEEPSVMIEEFLMETETVEVEETVFEIIEEIVAEEVDADEVEQEAEFEAVETYEVDTFEDTDPEIVLHAVDADIAKDTAADVVVVQPQAENIVAVAPENAQETEIDAAPVSVVIASQIAPVAAPISAPIVPVTASVKMDMMPVVAPVLVSAPQLDVAPVDALVIDVLAVEDKPVVAVQDVQVETVSAVIEQDVTEIAVTHDVQFALPVADTNVATVVANEVVNNAPEFVIDNASMTSELPAADVMAADIPANVVADAVVVPVNDAYVIAPIVVEENFIENEQDCVLPVMTVDAAPVLVAAPVVEQNVAIVYEMVAMEQDILQPAMPVEVMVSAEPVVVAPAPVVYEAATVTAPAPVVYIEKELAEQISSVVEQVPMTDVAEKLIVQAAQPKIAKEATSFTLLKDNAKDVTTAPDVFVKNGPVYAQPMVEAADGDWYGDVLSAQMTSFYYGMKTPSQV